MELIIHLPENCKCHPEKTDTDAKHKGVDAQIAQQLPDCAQLYVAAGPPILTFEDLEQKTRQIIRGLQTPRQTDQNQ